MECCATGIRHMADRDGTLTAEVWKFMFMK